MPQTPRAVLGKSLQGLSLSPHTDPPAVTMLRCKGCFVLFLRVLLNSLEIASSCRCSASRTSGCQSWGLFAALLLHFPVQNPRENPSSCSHSPQGTLGALPLTWAHPGLLMEIREGIPAGAGQDFQPGALSWRKRHLCCLERWDGHVHPGFGGGAGIWSSLGRLRRRKQGCWAMTIPDQALPEPRDNSQGR